MAVQSGDEMTFEELVGRYTDEMQRAYHNVVLSDEWYVVMHPDLYNSYAMRCVYNMRRKFRRYRRHNLV
jgi:hypothetical protein